MKPSNAGFLIWPQGRSQLVFDVDMSCTVGMANLFKSFSQPRARGNPRPILCFLVDFATAWSLGSGDQTHRVPKTKAACCRCLLCGSKLIDEFGEFISIDFDPAAADKMQAARRGEQTGNFRFGERLAVKCDFHAEI